jgi:hypothetical protein
MWKMWQNAMPQVISQKKTPKKTVKRKLPLQQIDSNKENSRKRAREHDSSTPTKKVKTGKENQLSLSSSVDFFNNAASKAKKIKEEKHRRKLQRQEREHKKNEETARKDEESRNNEEWEVESVGCLHLEWGRRLIKTRFGQIKTEFYIKPDEDQRIWIKWKADNSWSAEPLANLAGIDSKCLEKIIRKKEIWPMPSSGDGLPNWQERRNKVMLAGYSQWEQWSSVLVEKSAYQFHQGCFVENSSDILINIDDESDEETDCETDED